MWKLYGFYKLSKTDLEIRRSDGYKILMELWCSQNVKFSNITYPFELRTRSKKSWAHDYQETGDKVVPRLDWGNTFTLPTAKWKISQKLGHSTRQGLYYEPTEMWLHGTWDQHVLFDGLYCLWFIRHLKVYRRFHLTFLYQPARELRSGPWRNEYKTMVFFIVHVIGFL